jgi:hypothetical protein
MISVKLPLIASGKICQAEGGEDCRFLERRGLFLRKSLRCKLFDESLTHDGLSSDLSDISPVYRCEWCLRSQITEEE